MSEAVMRIGFSKGVSSGGWHPGGRRRGLGLSSVSSQRALRAEWEQLVADLIEISQSEHGVRAGQVLEQAPIPHFDEAPQMLDHAEGMLAAGAGPRTGAVDL